MLLHTSYTNPELTKQINDLVGNPFSLKKRITMSGIGSPKLHITSASAKISSILALNTNLNTCNIELRPHGIIVAFHVRLETYVLVIPYYKLSLYKGKAEEYSIYIDHHFIKISAKSKDITTHKFIKKILSCKASSTHEDDRGYYADLVRK